MSIETLNEQWRSLIGNKNLLTHMDSDDAVQNWIKVKNLKNNLEFPICTELADYILTLLSLPHSSAVAERAFTLNLIKNKKTNRLDNNTISNMMFTRTLIKENMDTDIYIPKEDLGKFAAKFKFKDATFEPY